MGAAYIDYVVADKTIIPEAHRESYTEKIAYLPAFQVNDRTRIISDRVFTREACGLPRGNMHFPWTNAMLRKSIADTRRFEFQTSIAVSSNGVRGFFTWKNACERNSIVPSQRGPKCVPKNRSWRGLRMGLQSR